MSTLKAAVVFPRHERRIGVFVESPLLLSLLTGVVLIAQEFDCFACVGVD